MKNLNVIIGMLGFAMIIILHISLTFRDKELNREVQLKVESIAHDNGYDVIASNDSIVNGIVKIECMDKHSSWQGVIAVDLRDNCKITRILTEHE